MEQQSAWWIWLSCITSAWDSKRNQIQFNRSSDVKWLRFNGFGILLIYRMIFFQLRFLCNESVSAVHWPYRICIPKECNVSHKLCGSVIMSVPSIQIPSTNCLLSARTQSETLLLLLLCHCSNCPVLWFHFSTLQISSFCVYLANAIFLYKYVERQRSKHQLVLWSLRNNVKNEGKSSFHSTTEKSSKYIEILIILNNLLVGVLILLKVKTF